MNKITFMRLWDLYNGLLTDTQREITDLYFNLDLTVSEIAEEKGVTRQAVSECLKTCKKQLEEYEDKLHISRRLTEISLQSSFMATDAALWAKLFMNSYPHLSEEVQNLLDILGKDYSEEVKSALESPEAQKAMDKDYSAEIDADILSKVVKITGNN